MAKKGPLQGAQALSFFGYSQRLAKVCFYECKEHIFHEQGSRVWLKRRREESEEVMLIEKVHKKIKKHRFLLGGGHSRAPLDAAALGSATY